MRTDNNSQGPEPGEEDEAIVEFWSDEGARRFNEALDEGSACMSVKGHDWTNSDFDDGDTEGEYCYPELYDPDDETLPPGELELIMENCYIM